MKILAIWRVKEDADFSKIEAILIEEERFAWRSYLSDELREHYESGFIYGWKNYDYWQRWRW